MKWLQKCLSVKALFSVDILLFEKLSKMWIPLHKLIFTQNYFLNIMLYLILFATGVISSVRRFSIWICSIWEGKIRKKFLKIFEYFQGEFWESYMGNLEKSDRKFCMSWSEPWNNLSNQDKISYVCLFSAGRELSQYFSVIFNLILIALFVVW